MAKKSSKGKDKKLARKAATERAAAVAAQLKELADGTACGAALAAQYPAFLRYEQKGLAAALQFYAAVELPPSLLGWALALTKQHMADLFNACPEWGWSDSKKRAELSDSAARYLVVFQQSQQAQQPAVQATAAAAEAAAAGGQSLSVHETAAAASGGGQENAAAAGNGGASVQPAGGASVAAEGQGDPVAFLHYRFEEEDGEAVLYCYEIQVAQAVQGKGLGRFLMQLFELLGRRSGVSRLMLTVFHENQAATALYRRLGYVLDADSPGTVDPSGDHKYEIMTKRLRPQLEMAPA